jgi:FMN phosphatase YigB (HAD superfamily)
VTTAIIFDCFGVLVTEGWIAFRDRYFADSATRQQAIDLRRAADWGSVPYEDFEQNLAALAGVSIATVRSYLQGNTPNELLLEHIQTDLKPHYKIGLLSNAASDALPRLFTPEQQQLFDATVLSYHLKVAKPDPRAYLAIAEKLSVDPEQCIFIDDNEYFCTAAREQGMRAICYKDFEQYKTELTRLLANSKN